MYLHRFRCEVHVQVVTSVIMLCNHLPVGDSLAHHNGKMFSTFDRDNDIHANNCASTFHGAWWYGACHDSNLNGKYLYGPYKSNYDGMNWETWKGELESVKTSEMKLRAWR